LFKNDPFESNDPPAPGALLARCSDIVRHDLLFLGWLPTKRRLSRQMIIDGDHTGDRLVGDRRVLKRHGAPILLEIDLPLRISSLAIRRKFAAKKILR
jgi:hypothetical protein